MTQAKLGPAPAIDPTAEVRGCTLGAYAEIGPRCILAETTFGDYSYVAGDAEIVYAAIGKFVSIASHTRINPGNHPMARATQHHFTYRASAYGLGEDDADFFAWRRAHAVSIGHDVWIGHGALIMPGRSVGTGAVVGAGTIVTRDVPDYAVCVGNPGRILRYRFSGPVQESLKRIAWWDWPHQTLAAALADFRGLPVEAFCEKHDPAHDK
ncbi:DapH/DapD/GlmU-related protein [Oleispirillum naphthae]|uniref:DapH/DapD/GlmU-related protein n=1 Tax=Oleispirillum naphthae TaxID=2838853 RepID=UPI0030823D68